MKINRHAKILDLISRDDIETQEELAEKLNAEGFPVTQATVSRDIREMKLTKVTNDRGRQVYKVMQGTETGMNEKYLRILRDGGGAAWPCQLLPPVPQHLSQGWAFLQNTVLLLLQHRGNGVVHDLLQGDFRGLLWLR